MYPARQLDIARKEELILAKQCRQATSKILRQNLPTLIEASPEFNQKKLVVPHPGTNSSNNSEIVDPDQPWHQEYKKKPIVHKPPSIPNRAPNFSITPIIEQRWLKKDQAKKKAANSNYISEFERDIPEWDETEEHHWNGDDDCTSMPALETVSTSMSSPLDPGRCSSRNSIGSAQFYTGQENKGSWYQLFQSQPQPKSRKHKSASRKEEKNKEEEDSDEEEQERKYSNKSESRQKMHRRNSKKAGSDKIVSERKIAPKPPDTTEMTENNKHPEDPPDTNCWNCKKCTLLNPLTETACLACGGSRLNSIGEMQEDPNNQIYLRTYINTKQEPVTEEELDKLRREKNLLPDGRWICELCTLQNEALSHYCDACNTKNTFVEIAEPVAEQLEAGQEGMHQREMLHKAVRYFGIVCLASILIYLVVSIGLTVANGINSLGGIFTIQGHHDEQTDFHQEPIIEHLPIIPSRSIKPPDNSRLIKSPDHSRDVFVPISSEPVVPSIIEDTAEEDISEEENVEGDITVPNPIYFIFTLLYALANAVVNLGESGFGIQEDHDSNLAYTFMQIEFLGLNPFILAIFIPVFFLLLYVNQSKKGDAKIAELIGQLERIVIREKRKAEKENCGEYNPQPIPRFVE